MRVVVDTVVLVRALMNPRGTWGTLISRRAEFTVVVSPELAAEAIRIVADPALARKLQRIEAIPAMDRLLVLLNDAVFVDPVHRFEISRDPNDDKLFECAVEGEADYIVSEDLDVLAIAEYQGVRTVAASHLLEIIDQD